MDKNNLQKAKHGALKVHQGADRFTAVLLIVYLIVLFWILLFKLGVRFSYMGNRNVNLIPFREFFLHEHVDVSQIILNIVIFMPLGIYTGALFTRWSFGRKLSFFFLISLTVEVLQLILAVGISDITDIIDNTVGGVIGLLIFMAIAKALGNLGRAKSFINVLSAIATVTIISFLVLLKMNMLPLRYR